MSEHVISVALLTVASIVAIGVLLHSVYPSIVDMSSSASSSMNVLENRLETKIKIVNTVNQSNDVYIWVKNIGTKRIALSQILWTDVFFGPENNFERIPYDSTRSISPSWNYTLENDGGNGHWDLHETNKITVRWDQSITTGDYYINVITYNGISDHEYISL